jgi:hypothetical protein
MLIIPSLVSEKVNVLQTMLPFNFKEEIKNAAFVFNIINHPQKDI